MVVGGGYYITYLLSTIISLLDSSSSKKSPLSVSMKPPLPNVRLAIRYFFADRQNHGEKGKGEVS